MASLEGIAELDESALVDDNNTALTPAIVFALLGSHTDQDEHTDHTQDQDENDNTENDDVSDAISAYMNETKAEAFLLKQVKDQQLSKSTSSGSTPTQTTPSTRISSQSDDSESRPSSASDRARPVRDTEAEAAWKAKKKRMSQSFLAQMRK